MSAPFRIRSLTEPVDGAALRRFRAGVESAEKRRIWPKVTAFITACVAVLFLALYVTEFDLDLVPWFVVGIAVLFAVCWLLLWRASRRRWRLRYRLDRVASENGFVLEHDVAAPDRPGRLFCSGASPVTVFRMHGRDGTGAELEIGLHSRTEPGEHGGSTTVETLYLLAPRRSGVLPGVMPAAPRPASASDATVPTGTAPAPPRPDSSGGALAAPDASIAVSLLDALPLVVVGAGDLETRFHFEEFDNRGAAYLVDTLDLTDPVSWQRLEAVRAWFAA
jgi:hypothetical protein